MGRRPLPQPEVLRLGSEIRQRRTSMGITVAALARRAQLTPNYVSDIENGRRHRNPSLVTLLALAKALDTEVADLFGPHTREQSPEVREAAALVDGLSEDMQPAVLALLRALTQP